MSSVQPASAGCEIEIRPGQQCGIPPIGRCASCGLAFCLTHQARNPRLAYVDMCMPCFLQTPEQVQRVKLEAYHAQKAAAEGYFSDGKALAALQARGVPTVRICSFKEEWVRHTGLFARGGHYVKKVTYEGRGWNLGVFHAEYKNIDTHQPLVVDLPTALMDAPYRDLPDTVRSGYGLVFIDSLQKDVYDYELEGGMEDTYELKHAADQWIWAMEAVKRLCGESS